MDIRVMTSLVLVVFAAALFTASILLRRRTDINRWVLIYCAVLFVVAAIATWLSWIKAT
jgi:cytochrome bd-type quinol oxidase subunit 1